MLWEIRKVVKKGEYLYAVVPDHPNRHSKDYVLMHRIIMENHIGRLLDKDEIVHHLNGNKHDNRIENLEIMSPEEHASFHGAHEEKEYVKMGCPECKQAFEREKHRTHLSKGGDRTFCSRRCNGKNSTRTESKEDYYYNTFVEVFRVSKLPVNKEFVNNGEPHSYEYYKNIYNNKVSTKPKERLCIRKVERPSKDELYTLITTTPFLQIGKLYGVSDNAVRKWCKLYGLPYTKKDITMALDRSA